ncbi:hypothetical protein BN2476_80119 [Paraburkholderia piptadeniae]|uniref:Uncharacterized protein n=1 Tax=Paraburkholderia piptadeniae TaxID=1701573 RepID=A0A1N7RM89_9BURK|nr:hypothetical protein BN2476_80119 [Paraburkholderia piptadeniae]
MDFAIRVVIVAQLRVYVNFTNHNLFYYS